MKLDDLPGDGCAVCGASLEGRDLRRIYCSMKCKNARFNDWKSAKRREARRGLACPGCGAIFDATKADQIFCSEACNRRVLYQRAKAKEPEKPCVVCGALFRPSPIGPRARTCSRSCRSFLRERERRPKQRTAGEDRVCPACGETFHVASAFLTQAHCSRQCAWVTRKARGRDSGT